MGFSIGSFLGKIAGPIIGGLIGGPAGAVLGAGISAGFQPAAFAAGTPPFSRPSQVGPTVRRTAALVPRAVVRGGVALLAGAGVIAELFRVSRERTGNPINRQKVVDAVKHCGIELAAELFQLSETEICQIVISKGRRRARGISAADLRRTRSTIRKVHNIAHDLQRLKAPAVRRHHK